MRTIFSFQKIGFLSNSYRGVTCENLSTLSTLFFIQQFLFFSPKMVSISFTFRSTLVERGAAVTCRFNESIVRWSAAGTDLGLVGDNVDRFRTYGFVIRTYLRARTDVEWRQG